MWRWMTHRGNRAPIETQYHDLPLIPFSKLQDATDDFSLTNKLGQGGFGPVYKGILEDGQHIAVKRLSAASGQGLQEFTNEVLLISKLQRNNLVKLLGCCIEGEEKIIVYEFMPNESLDAILFDPRHSASLDWSRRYQIVLGICRGLLYLHRDSRLRIIHRDMKTSNILLDEEFNPKISDLGMARIFATHETEASTQRVVGTFGYMSPEYAVEGRIYEKSDVYSLGVIMLEVVSGRKNFTFRDDGCMSLVDYAWKLWSENNQNLVPLVDQTLLNSHSEEQMIRCAHIGLLCVQESAVDRPSVWEVISLFENDEISDLPHPREPGTLPVRLESINEATVTTLSAR